MEYTMFEQRIADDYSIDIAIMVKEIEDAIVYGSVEHNNIMDNREWACVNKKYHLKDNPYFYKEMEEMLLGDMVNECIIDVHHQDDSVWITFTKDFFDVYKIPRKPYIPPKIPIPTINKNTIHEEAKRFMRAFPTLMCVYVLWSNSVLSYIGKTTMGMDRIITSANGHRNEKPITHFSVIHVDNEKELDIQERMLILENNPPMNKMFLEVVYKNLIQKIDLVDIYSLVKVRLVGDDFYE